MEWYCNMGLLCVGCLLAPNVMCAETEPQVDLGGYLSVVYESTSWDAKQRDTGGDVTLEQLALDVKSQTNGVQLDAEYRVMSQRIHHAWIGYKVNETAEAALGFVSVPFGLLPYSAHSWWENIDTYIGQSDERNMGLVWKQSYRNTTVHGAFFKASDYKRSLEDVEEANQVAGRVGYQLSHGHADHTELGLSGQVGQIYDRLRQRSGNNYQIALHTDSRIGRYNLKLQTTRYQYRIRDDSGSFAATFANRPSAASLYIAAISYDIPLSFSRVKVVTCYNDFSTLRGGTSVDPSTLETLGCVVPLAPVWIYTDLMFGNNVQYFGMVDRMGGDASLDEGWRRRLYITVAYYF